VADPPPSEGACARRRRIAPPSIRPGRRQGGFWRFRLCGIFLAVLVGPVAAQAQVSGSVALQSNYIFRGYSISAGKPAAILNLSYDTPAGFYANGSAIADIDGADNPAFLGAIANLGYAHRVNDMVSLDAGVIHSQYYEIYGRKADLGYTEEYLGVVTRHLSARLSYSSDYFTAETHTVYGEVEGGHEVWAGINVSAHAGYLDYVASPAGYQKRTNQYDWRLAASRLIKPVLLFVQVSGGGPAPDYYLGQQRSKTVVMGGVSCAF